MTTLRRTKKLLTMLLLLSITLPFTPVSAATVKQPKITNITTTINSATLKMKKNNSSCSLKIYRSTKKASGYKLIATIKNTKYTDKKLSQNKTYYYKVRAYKNAKYSKYSQPVKAKTKSSSNKNLQNNPQTSLKTQVRTLVNEERAKNGLSAVTMTDQLQKAADARAKEIVQSFSHTRPDGSSCFTVLNEYNISYQICGENIAYGYKTAASVMHGWMNSPGHRANILNESFGKIGIGEYNGNWVQLFTD